MNNNLRLRRPEQFTSYNNENEADTEFDIDSEYANHPPPTDSELEFEMELEHERERERERQLRNFTRLQQMNNGNGTSYANNSTNNNSNNDNIGNGNFHHHQQEFLYGAKSTAMEDLYLQRNKLKNYGLKRLNVKQHIIITICRDLPIYSILKNFFELILQWYKLITEPYNSFITVRATEFFLASLWCLVSALLSYIILDGLMVRWMLIYEINAIIVRILSMSLIIILLIEMFKYTFNNLDNDFCLTVWIFISCVLTVFFIIQCFTSKDFDIDKKDLIDSSYMDSLERDSSVNSTNTISKAKIRKHRKVDLYNLVVFAVVPIGVASFISTVGLVRLLVILRLDIGMEMNRIQLVSS